MSLDLISKSLFTRRFLRANIAIGLAVTALALYLIFTNDYSSLQDRKASEALLNRFALGGLIYMALVWSACQLGKPFMQNRSKS